MFNATWISRIGLGARIAILGLVAGGSVFAAQPTTGALPTTPGLTYKMYDVQRFYPLDAGALVTNDILGSYIYTGVPVLQESLDLPSGAGIEEITWYFIDNGDGVQVFQLLSVAPGSITAVVLSSTDTSGMVPNSDVRSITVTGTPIATIDNSQSFYRLYAYLGGEEIAYQLSGVRVGYRLQVSPAPATASFLDVPTTDPFFRYIEALKAAGISSGCGDGTNFCPNQPVLRKQMATFLAKALGLNWQ